MAAVYTFDIVTDRDYFDRILTPAIAEYRTDSLTVVKAMTCSVFLLQFTDWVFHCNTGIVTSLLGPSADEKKLTEHFSQQWDCYHSIRCIATGTKHFNVTNKRVSNVQNTDLQHGFYSPLGITESHLTMRMTDGSLRFVDYDVINCYDKWVGFVTGTLSWQL